jgi:hypothetical protein
MRENYRIDAEYIFALTEMSAFSHEQLTTICAEIADWCVDQFGPSSVDARVWAKQGWTFSFWNQADATAFRIRWC